MRRSGLRGLNVSPWVRGTLVVDFGDDVFGATRRGHGAVTVVPRLTNPWASGGVTCISTTSSGKAPVSKRPSISLRKIGV